MAILKKAEFEKEVKNALEKAMPDLFLTVNAESQYFDHGITTVTFKVNIAINGHIEELPRENDPWK